MTEDAMFSIIKAKVVKSPCSCFVRTKCDGKNRVLVMFLSTFHVSHRKFSIYFLFFWPWIEAAWFFFTIVRTLKKCYKINQALMTNNELVLPTTLAKQNCTVHTRLADSKSLKKAPMGVNFLLLPRWGRGSVLTCVQESCCLPFARTSSERGDENWVPGFFGWERGPTIQLKADSLLLSARQPVLSALPVFHHWASQTKKLCFYI